MKKQYRHIWLMIIMLFLASCARVNIKPSLDDMEQWDLKGKVGVTLGNDGGSASFSWTRTGESQWIELSGPLGIGRVNISQIGNKAKLVDSKGNIAFASNIDDLLLAYVQWPIPFNDMTSWVSHWRSQEKGLENPDQTLSIYKNWQLDIRDVLDIDGASYPRKVFFTAKPNFRQYVGDVLTRRVSEGMIEPLSFSLPPKEIKVKIIFSSIK